MSLKMVEANRALKGKLCAVTFEFVCTLKNYILVIKS